MRTRLRTQLDAKSIRLVSISTFHRLGLNILQQDGTAMGLRRGFTIRDQTDSLAALRDISNEQQCTLDERIALQRISQWKNAFIDPTAALAASGTDEERIAALLYADYNALLRACNSVDFDDLISLPVTLLRDHSDIHSRWHGRVRHLLVDEYQDTNAAQYALMNLLVDKFGELTAVGDDDQSIYSWRGARPENLSHLREDFPNLKVIKLEQNYRSTQRILTPVPISSLAITHMT